MDWYSIYIVDKKIFIFANVAFSQFLTLEIAYSEKLRLMWNMTSGCLGLILPMQFTAINDLTYDSLVYFSSTGHSLNLSFEPSSSVLVFYNI